MTNGLPTLYDTVDALAYPPPPPLSLLSHSSALFDFLLLQKEVQAADIPARENNVEAFLAAQASVEKKFEEFMEMFNDVPSEL